MSNTLNNIYDKLDNIYLAKQDIRRTISDKFDIDLGGKMEEWYDKICENNIDALPVVSFFDYDGTVLYEYNIYDLIKKINW